MKKNQILFVVLEIILCDANLKRHVEILMTDTYSIWKDL